MIKRLMMVFVLCGALAGSSIAAPAMAATPPGKTRQAAKAKSQARHQKTRQAKRSQATGTEQPGETTTEQESTVEAEAGQPGEPANGHADAPGQSAAHECTGNCVE
jgi:hypothetical protein